MGMMYVLGILGVIGILFLGWAQIQAVFGYLARLIIRMRVRYRAWRVYRREMAPEPRARNVDDEFDAQWERRAQKIRKAMRGEQ